MLSREITTPGSLEAELQVIRRSQRRLHRLLIAVAGCVLVTLLLGAAAAVTTFNGNVAITGDLSVSGKINGVDVNAGEIKVGMMVPYFGDQLPNNSYCWADGRAEWPREDWVPKHLKEEGIRVPNMTGELLGGAASESEIGLPWKSGRISIESTTRTSDGEVLFWRRGPQVPSIIKVNGPDAQIQSISPISYVSHVSFPRDNSSLVLDSTDFNPRHIRCRWIIRIK